MTKQISTENIKSNLIAQVRKIAAGTNEGGFKTVGRYTEAMIRFCGFLAKEYHLQNIKNVSGKHVFAYVEHMQKSECSANTIYTDLSGIRWFHARSGSKNILPSNKELNLEKRLRGIYDRGWLEKEYEAALACAQGMDRIDCYFAIKLSNCFGLRLEGTCILTVKQVENALKHHDLNIAEKGGLERQISVRNEEQVFLLNELLGYAKNNKKHGGDKILPYSKKKGSVRQRMRAISDWIAHNRHKFMSDDRAELNRQNKLAKEAGVRLMSETISLHGLRYKYLQTEYKYYIEQGFGKEEALRRVSLAAGHFRIEITLIYIGKDI